MHQPARTHQASSSPYDWRLRGVRWGDVASYQHWGGLLLFIPAIVIIGVSHWTFQEAPAVRQALMYDATISYPHKGHDTIPNGLATLYNWLCLLGAVVIVELLLFRRQHSLTVGFTGIVHQVWCCAVSFVIVLAITEITKPFSGRLRPDFLARCQPSELAGATSPAGSTAPSAPTLSSAAPSLGSFRLGQVAGPCTNSKHTVVRDGRLSFPSGHASGSMAVAWYTTLYVVWSLYLRVDAPYPGRLHPVLVPRAGTCGRLGRRLVQELWHALVYAFILLTLCLSWFIGMTRFWDNVHNVSDIVGGFVLAIIFTTPYVIKAVGLQACFREHIDGPPGLPLTAAAAVDGSDDKKHEPLTTQHGVPAAAGGASMLPLSTHSSALGVGGALGAGEIGARPSSYVAVSVPAGAAGHGGTRPAAAGASNRGR